MFVNVKIGNLKGRGFVPFLARDHLGMCGNGKRKRNVYVISSCFPFRFDNRRLAGTSIHRNRKRLKQGHVVTAYKGCFCFEQKSHRQECSVAFNGRSIDARIGNGKGTALGVIYQFAIWIRYTEVICRTVGRRACKNVKVLREATLHENFLEIGGINFNAVLISEEGITESTTLFGRTTVRSEELILFNVLIEIGFVATDFGCEEGRTATAAADVAGYRLSRHNTAGAAAKACTATAAAEHTGTARTWCTVKVVSTAPVIRTGLGGKLTARGAGALAGGVCTAPAYVSRGCTA